MFRRILAILLLLCLSYQNVARLAIIAWYEYNKEYIAKNLCENRNKPEMKCCGKCYLKKQLKKTEQGSQDKTNVPSKWNSGEIAVYTLPQPIPLPAPYFITRTSFPAHPANAILSGHPAHLLKPPSVC